MFVTVCICMNYFKRNKLWKGDIWATLFVNGSFLFHFTSVLTV